MLDKSTKPENDFISMGEPDKVYNLDNGDILEYSDKKYFQSITGLFESKAPVKEIEYVEGMDLSTLEIETIPVYRFSVEWYTSLNPIKTETVHIVSKDKARISSLRKEVNNHAGQADKETLRHIKRCFLYSKKHGNNVFLNTSNKKNPCKKKSTALDIDTSHPNVISTSKSVMSEEKYKNAMKRIEEKKKRIAQLNAKRPVRPRSIISDMNRGVEY